MITYSVTVVFRTSRDLGEESLKHVKKSIRKDIGKRVDTKQRGFSRIRGLDVSLPYKE